MIKKKNQGFTLIELLVIIVILAIIVIIAIPIFNKIVRQSRINAAIDGAYMYKNAIENDSAKNMINDSSYIDFNKNYLVKRGSAYEEELIAYNDDIFLAEYVKTKGKAPDDGYIEMGSKLFKHGIFLFDDIEVECDETYCYLKGYRVSNSIKPTGELWDGWITLTLYYPENSTERKYRIGEPGEVRGEDDWIDYTGSITVPLSQVSNVYIKYKLKDKVYIVSPNSKYFVEIQPSSYIIKDKITFKIIASDNAKVYYKTASEWIEYDGSEIEYTKSGLIEAKAVITENVYRSDGTVAYTQTVTEYDSVFIRTPQQSSGGSSGGGSDGGSYGGYSGNGWTYYGVPSYYLEGPQISANPSTLTSSPVTVTISTAKAARKVYYKIGNSDYTEYSAPFTVSENTTISAYYISADEGQTSGTSTLNISNSYPSKPAIGSSPACDLPYLYINPSTRSMYVDFVNISIDSANADEVLYSLNGVEYNEYKNQIKFTSNQRVYAKATNTCGTTTVYYDITNIGKRGQELHPPVKKNLKVDITATPDSSISSNVDSVKVTVNYASDSEKRYYKIDNGDLKEYKGPFSVKKNATIYAYAISENGYGEASKLIDNIGTETLSKPIISVSPKDQASSVTVSINYPKNASIKKYRIDNGSLIDYTGSFKVDKNCTIYAYASNGTLQEDSSYKIDNIKKIPIYVIDYGDYYLVKLNYPPTASVKEYKYMENGTWKTYKDEGFIFVKPGTPVDSNGIVKIVVDGKEVEYNGDWYYITGSLSSVFENIFMRWDPYYPSAPSINLSTNDPTLKVDVNIDYDDQGIKNEFKIVNPDGTTTGYKKYTKPFEITKKNTTIYARTMTGNEVYSNEAIKTITNIDEEAPSISLRADFETVTAELKITVNVTDDIRVDSVMYDSGLRSSSYFKTNGNLISNNSTVTIKDNGTYTFFAKDTAGNTQLYNITVDNIDNVAPTVSIYNRASQEASVIEDTITIDYGDSTVKQYKIGNGSYQTYSEPFKLDSYTVLSNNLATGNSVKICAKGTDHVGNVTEVCKNIYSLDLDMPEKPVITSTAGYPTMANAGVVLDNTVTIEYDSRNDIDNYYSTDGENWHIYTGQYKTSALNIYAKSVKKNTGLTSSSTYSMKTPSDALETVAYDGDLSTGTFYGIGTATRWMFVNSSMQGMKMHVTTEITGWSNIEFTAYDEDGNSLGSLYNSTSSGTGTFTIPENAYKIKIYSFTHNHGNAGTHNAIFEIRPYSEAVISHTYTYPVLSTSGVIQPYNTVSINYFDTSVQKLYKINDGNWTNYTGPVRLEIGQTIYAKGIDVNGNETVVTSYTSAIAGDSLELAAYDGDSSTGTFYGIGEATKWILVDPSMYGKKAYISMFSAGIGSRIDLNAIDNAENSLGNMYRSYDTGSGTFTIPENTSKIQIYSYTHNHGNSGTHNSIYEIRPND